MKAILKIVWFALLIILFQKIIAPIFPGNNLSTIADKLPFGLGEKSGIQRIFSKQYFHQLIFVLLLFLGLDIIGGEIKGFIKWPFKLALNAVFYLIGFFLVFLIIDEFSILL